MPRWLYIAAISFFITYPAYAYAPYTHLLCKSPGYTCLKVKKHQSWESLFPDTEERFMVMRVNRMNTPVYTGMTIALPINLEHTQFMKLSPFPAEINPLGKKIIIVSPRLLAWAAYDPNGQIVNWGPASLGSDWCRDLGHRCHSPVGTFHVYQKGSGSCKSTKFPLPHGGAPMPYCMFFKGGFALHGEPDGLPADNVSHGCVRLFESDAEWLSKQFVDIGTEVMVEPYGNFSTSIIKLKVNENKDGTIEDTAVFDYSDATLKPKDKPNENPASPL